MMSAGEIFPTGTKIIVDELAGRSPEKEITEKQDSKASLLL